VLTAEEKSRLQQFYRDTMNKENYCVKIDDVKSFLKALKYGDLAVSQCISPTALPDSDVDFKFIVKTYIEVRTIAQVTAKIVPDSPIALILEEFSEVYRKIDTQNDLLECAKHGTLRIKLK
jgi:hypothetical protein